MDSPEFVAKRSLEAFLKKELNVIFGGEERHKEIKMNFEAPEQFDKIVAQNYEDRKKSSLEHKAL